MIDKVDAGKRYLSLEETQAACFEMLVELDAIFRKNGLRYDLCGGTLLGAVRHKGFIPWDDDIDIAMPRPDYERFIELVTSGAIALPEQRQLLSSRDGSLMRHYARYVRSDIMRDAAYATDDDCPYISLDIFTVDGAPSSDSVFRAQTRRIRILRRMMLLAASRPRTSSRGGAMALAKDLLRPVVKALGMGRIVKMLENTCKKYPYENSVYVGIANGMYGLKERWLKSEMLPQVEFEFCGRRFFGYENYDRYLSNLYGDTYMELPPESARTPHHDPFYRVI